MEKTGTNFEVLGYFLAEAKMTLGPDLLPKDVELMTTYPKRGLAVISAKIVRLGKMDEAATERFSRILGMVDDIPGGFLHPDHQGELLLGYNRYRRDAAAE